MKKILLVFFLIFIYMISVYSEISNNLKVSIIFPKNISQRNQSISYPLISSPSIYPSQPFLIEIVDFFERKNNIYIKLKNDNNKDIIISLKLKIIDKRNNTLIKEKEYDNILFYKNATKTLKYTKRKNDIIIFMTLFEEKYYIGTFKFNF